MMKVLVVVALFAFVAVQVCQSAPVPDEDKADKSADIKKDELAAPAAVADIAATAAAVPETKLESVSSDAAKPADLPAAPIEDKKE